MSSSQFQEYIDYNSIAPFGDERNNIHAGIIASSVINSGFKSVSKPVEPSDFILKTEGQRAKEQAKKEADALIAFMERLG